PSSAEAPRARRSPARAAAAATNPRLVSRRRCEWPWAGLRWKRLVRQPLRALRVQSWRELLQLNVDRILAGGAASVIRNGAAAGPCRRNTEMRAAGKEDSRPR